MAKLFTGKAGFGFAFNQTGAQPLDDRSVVQSYAELLKADTFGTAIYNGMIVATVDEQKLYMLVDDTKATTADGWKEVGAGGAVSVDTYAEAVLLATDENIGQVIYVKTKSSYDANGEGAAVEYDAAPYIVIGAGSLQKLAASTASGDIATDLAALTTRVGTAEGEIDALQTAVGDTNSGLVKDVDDLQTLTGEHTETLSGYGERIYANEIAISGLRNAVKGGVHFRGVHAKLPELSIDEEGDVIGSYTDAEGFEHRHTFETGDVIIVAYYDEGDGDDPIKEPTKEYILVHEGVGDTEDSYKWIELGDVSVSDQKIADLEKEFDEHVAGVAKMLEPYALVANVVANETFNQHVSGASDRMDGIDGRLNGIDAAIRAIPVKSVTTGDVLKLSGAGELSVDMSNFVTKDGDKVLSTNDFTNDLKAKLDGVAAGAQVNVIESVAIDGTALDITNKGVNIEIADVINSKIVVNGVVASKNAETDTVDVAIDASDIYLSTDIGDNVAASTTVQSMVAKVYDIANAKMGTMYLAEGATSNVLALSKTTVANDTITLKIAEGSAIKATTAGLDLVWETL